MSNLIQYGNLLNEIKVRIRQAQAKAVFSANAEMLRMYFDVGRMILEKQQKEGWGSSVIPQLAKDIRNELPEQKGFSERNIGYMIRFAKEYGNSSILQQAVAKLSDSDLIWNIPWGHHALLMEKIKDKTTRYWYMEQTIQNGWSRDVLGLMIKNNAHNRQGKSVTNFNQTMPDMQSDLVRQALKDPYVFDFFTLTEPFQERELETGLVKHLEKFLIELGAGFSFVGRQYHIEISDKDYYLDLLFYHLKLRCFVVVDLKKGGFKPEYAGKMNFYCSVFDDKLKHETDNPTIGLILCQTKDRVLAEYALRDIHKPIGVSDYELTRALPDQLKSSLPTVEEIEQELAGLKEDENE
ncbi:MAG: PDDEXK nuclease domain-containing protein [bacterium]